MSAKPRAADIATSCEGSLWTFMGRTPRGRLWLARHVDDSENGAAVAESRYGMDIACGALRAGLRLQGHRVGALCVPP